MNQNDISKRHQNDINDTSKKDLVIHGVFGNSFDETLYVCSQKMGKIAAALHLVADIMPDGEPLANSLHHQSLVMMRTGYAAIGKSPLTSEILIGILMSIDQVLALVDIGSIARTISRMNADILTGELNKVRELIVDMIHTIKKTEQSFVLSQYAVHHPVIHTELLQDTGFDTRLKDYQSKRHQNDIKTTLITQNDNQNDIIKIKTTSSGNVPRIGRQKDILNIIKSANDTTLALLKIKIPDCSEKTLQRELVSLIEMGLIRKEGNKRWTTYRAV